MTLASIRCRRRYSFAVQALGYYLERIAGRVIGEDAPNRARLLGVDLQPDAVIVPPAAVAKHTPASMQLARYQATHSTMNALGGVRQEELVYHPTCVQEQLKRLIRAVDALGYEHNAHSGEV
ncbi:MAG: hypothetical protein L0338_09455 [Acidobacteria bacterium]|nr:hypothetical protein [Acidobacteriota bacterium]